ncbi:MAG: type II toxin-antitoxin system RelE/ParE family toxin [Oscillospiraceae bacterium]|nr:type II toxin-antitoxin system RelE/ParE family toxin [Oscillospiraceae bacterium]
MKIKYSKSALKFLAKIQRATAQNIREAINGLTHNPPKGDIKPMQGYNDGRMRLRAGKYRIIYRYDIDNELEILYIIDIGSRGDIYK